MTEEKSVALSNPKVNSSVDLHLNQNDLIDIAIQEKLALLSAQIKQTEAAMKATAEGAEILHQALLNVEVAKMKKADKGYDRFLSAIKSLGLNYDVDKGGYHISRHESISVGEYTNYDLNYVEDCKDPLRALSRSKRIQSLNVSIPAQLYLEAMASDDAGFSIRYQGQYKDFSKTWQASYLKKIRVIKEDELRLRKIYYDLNVEYLQHQYGEKRIKAQIMRKSLSKSVEGRGILKMLEEATKIKVLG